MNEIEHYDMIVIGSGPAGEKAATQASKLKKKVAIIEKSSRLGGVSLHTGTIPSKSLRETVIHFSLLRQQTHGIDINFRENLTTNELMFRKEMVIRDQENSLRRNFEKNKIKISPYKLNALKGSISLVGQADKEYEAYSLEDRPRYVISLLKKYCL